MEQAAPFERKRRGLLFFFIFHREGEIASSLPAAFFVV